MIFKYHYPNNSVNTINNNIDVQKYYKLKNKIKDRKNIILLPINLNITIRLYGPYVYEKSFIDYPIYKSKYDVRYKFRKLKAYKLSWKI